MVGKWNGLLPGFTRLRTQIISHSYMTIYANRQIDPRKKKNNKQKNTNHNWFIDWDHPQYPSNILFHDETHHISRHGFTHGFTLVPQRRRCWLATCLRQRRGTSFEGFSGEPNGFNNCSYTILTIIIIINILILYIYIIDIYIYNYINTYL